MVGAGGTSPLAPLRRRPEGSSPGWSLRAFSVTASAGRGALARPSATELGSRLGSQLGSPAGTQRPSRAPSSSEGLRAPAGAQAPEPSQGLHFGALPVGGGAPAGDWDGESPEAGARRRGRNPNPAPGARHSGGSEARGSADGPLGIGMSQSQPGHSQNVDPRVGPGAAAAPAPGFEAYGFSGTPEAFSAPMRAGLANLPGTPIIPLLLPQQGGSPPRAPLSPSQSPNVGSAGLGLPPPWKPDALGGERARPALGAAARANALWRHS